MMEGYNSYSGSYQGYDQTDATQGSSLLSSPFLLIFLGVIVCLVIYFIYQKIRFLILRKNQIALTSDWVMYKVLVPKESHADNDDQKKNFQEMTSMIESFYSNLNSIFSEDIAKKISGQDHISLEIISSNNLIKFYFGCPKRISNTVIDSLYAQYPHAEIKVANDYSIFPDKPLEIDVLNLGLNKKFIFPVKTYKLFNDDPLNAVTNAMAGLDGDNSAAIQLILRPTSGVWRSSVEKSAHDIQDGKVKSTYSNSTAAVVGETIFNAIGSTANTIKNNNKAENSYYQYKMTPMQENQVKLLGEKSSKIGFETQIRIIAVAPQIIDAKRITRNICSAFSQFNNPDSNGFKVFSVMNKSEEITNFIFRIVGRGPRMILNTEELSSVFHLPNRFLETPAIAWLPAKKQSPPSNLPKEGTTIGNSEFRGGLVPINIKESDRMRHVYMIGKTGVGKTVLFQNMILQDIREGKGVCYLDPNGDAAEWIMNHIPKERADDVVYFDPADLERPFGLNVLEWKTPEQRDFLVQETIQIFYKLFDPNQTGMIGPQFEHWMRNASLTLMSNPSGGTLIDIPRLFTDQKFEKEMVSFVTDPVVKSFWEQQMAKTADFHKSEMLNYFTSKFGRFMTNDMMRNIIGQTKSSFDFRDVMDNKKILICNLSKGKIGEMNAFLLGMIIVSKIAMGAFSRQDIPEEERVPFYLYVDEFQNFITDVFATILSESRKYKLSLSITNQYIAQLDDKIREAVIGNAGTLISFRVGAGDAEFLVKEFDPLNIEDMTNIDKYNFYIKMLIDGAPSKPFNGKSIWPDNYEGNPTLGAAIKELSRLKYGRSRDIIEKEILERSQVHNLNLPGIDSSDSNKVT